MLNLKERIKCKTVKGKVVRKVYTNSEVIDDSTKCVPVILYIIENRKSINLVLTEDKGKVPDIGDEAEFLIERKKNFRVLHCVKDYKILTDNISDKINKIAEKYN